jgi:hypothetical protein
MMLEILNQPWLGSVIAIVGLLLAVVGLFSYRAARIGARPYYFLRARRLIGKRGQELPEEVEITFDGHPVPQLTVSQCFLWNAGNASISGSDIVPSDPLRVEFEETDEILKARLVRGTREVNNVEIDSPPKAHRAFLRFDFLDPGDGAVIELVHTSALRVPRVKGTIKGIPEGLVDVGGGPKDTVFARVADRFPLGRNFLIGMLVFGVGMVVFSVLPKSLFPATWFEPLQTSEIGITGISLLSFVLGVLYMGLPGLLLFAGRRKYPAALDPDGGDGDESPDEAPNKPVGGDA